MNLPNKFQCHYKLTFQFEENGDVFHAEVRDPITINFNVSKATFGDVNSASIVVYNLDAVTRECIYQDRLLLNPEKRKMVTLEAGYGDTLTLVCLGYIQQCYSERKGTDFVTTIDVLDPDILTQYTSVTFQAGTTFEEAYKFLVSQFPTLKQGECGQLNGTFKTPTVFEGNGFWALNELTGGHSFVDNGVINTLNDNETLQGYQAYLISSETGLLGTPKRYDALLEVNMLFEPTIRVGQLVEIQSETWSAFNGQYKVLGYTHNCTISGAVGGARTTTLQLQYVRYLTNSNVNLTSNPEGSQPAKIANGKAEPINIQVSSQAKEVYKYIKNDQWSLLNGLKITERISWKEMLFASKANTKADIKNNITEQKLESCRQIALQLTRFLNLYFPYQTISIGSGYRTPQSNAKIENSSNNSNHMRGSAIDFSMNNVPVNQLTQVFKRYWKLGLGCYSWGLHVSLSSSERF